MRAVPPDFACILLLLLSECTVFQTGPMLPSGLRPIPPQAGSSGQQERLGRDSNHVKRMCPHYDLYPKQLTAGQPIHIRRTWLGISSGKWAFSFRPDVPFCASLALLELLRQAVRILKRHYSLLGAPHPSTRLKLVNYAPFNPKDAKLP